MAVSPEDLGRATRTAACPHVTVLRPGTPSAGHISTSGLGYLIQQAGDYRNTALVLPGIICIAVIALALDACLRGLLLLADPSRRG